MAQEYGESIGQGLGDDQWITEMTAKGFVLFSKDVKSLTGKHRPTIEKCGARVFLIPKADLTGPEMARRYVNFRFKIATRAQRPGPMIYRVYADRLDRVK